ncbi:pentapeptide repeat-containing protein [Methylophaga pinxianii]|uniref:pentapeptide repeat-containing protein n=1 Tax=Methylophaga pinxianii TaxID=2881052 RepID=UPI001CF43A64|nr:pentapeptide repeat-containing protein [Methylophaga pinxianii]MCB2426308.1 pentapeptide repeat-containing protein [Methylophaga pinxianii]UPH46685.1 pentapeptide repeat-containing protein [Methylophaga pinxianii]
MKKFSTKWYTRQNDTISGPFTLALLKSNLLLGRINAQTEVSADQKYWQPLGDIIALQTAEPIIPPPLTLDERDGFDRRNDQPLTEAEREMRREQRRKQEPDFLIQQRQQRTELLEKLKPERPARFWPFFIISLILTGIFVGAVLFPTPPIKSTADCDAAPARQVNWENCLKPGMDIPSATLTSANLRNSGLAMSNLMNADLVDADLSYADLSLSNMSYALLQGSNLKGANLQQADLSYSDLTDSDLSFANLRDARLGGSNLHNAKLDKAIWIDGRICAEGSVGNCL